MIQFKAGGRFFLGLNVIVLGAGGCGVMISSLLASSLHPGDPLDRILIHHPELPMEFLQGKVSWIRGRQPDLDKDSVLLGIEFTDPSEPYLSAVDAVVTKVLSA